MSTQSRTSYSRIARNRARIGLQREVDAVPAYIWRGSNPANFVIATADLVVAVRNTLELLRVDEERNGSSEYVRAARTELSEAMAAVE